MLFNQLQISFDEPGEIREVQTREVKRGDLYILGDHRILCGDSTDPDDLDRLMGGGKADLIHADPPYGLGKEIDGVMNDNQYGAKLLDFNRQWIAQSFRVMKDVGSWYCWGFDEPLMDIYAEILKPMMAQNKITFRNLITWYKGMPSGVTSPEMRSYQKSDEKCLFVMGGVQGFNTNSDNYWPGWEPIRSYLDGEKKKMGWNAADIDRITGVTTVSRHCFGPSQWLMPTEEHYKELQEAAKGEAFRREYEDLRREYYASRAFFDNTHDKMTTVWDIPYCNGREKKDAGNHPTVKPLELCRRVIKSSSRPGATVLDPFGGSGSTLIACEQTRRKCCMMELSEQWAAHIIRRWEEFTGKKATKEDTTNV